MANVFISYSAGDRAHAVQIAEYINDGLEQDRALGAAHDAWFYEDVQEGTPVGSEWRDVLFERLRWADAVICLLSENYNKSLWCAAEIATALTLGCDLLPVRVGAFEKEHSMLVAYSYADWLGDVNTAKERLKRRLLDIDAMGGLASWTAGEWPYPGLRPFERRDASVYFGRKQEMLDIVALLQSPKQRLDPEMITIVGPSGCGKSSLARAAITPYLAGRRQSWFGTGSSSLASAPDDLGKKRMWLPVRPFVPGADPLESLGSALSGSVADYGLKVDVPQLRKDLQSSLSVCAATILNAAGVEDDCQLLLVVDQLEQLFSVTGKDRRQAFVDSIKPALAAGGRVRALATMRPEFLDRTFIDSAFSTVKTRVFPLGPLGDDELAEVIEAPAARARLTIEAGLVNRMVRETGGGKNLPLLALTLHRLKDFRRPEEDGFDLSVDGYRRSGGIREALSTQADEALTEARKEAALTGDGPVIDTLMDLVGVRGATPTRKTVAKSAFDAAQQRILDQFERRRLVVYENRDNATYVAIAHDLLIEKWDKLADEFRARRAFLQALEPIDAGAEKWEATGRHPGRLLRSEDLVAAMSSLDVHDTRRIRLPWSRYRPDMIDDPRIDERASAYLKASIRADNRNYGRWAVGIVCVLTVIAAVAQLGWVQKRQADAALHQETITRLISEGEGMVSQITPEGTVRGLQQLLTGNAISNDAERDALLSPVVQLSRTVKIFQTPEAMRAVALNPDGSVVAAGGHDGQVWMWGVSDGLPKLAQPLSIGETEVTTVQFSRDGTRLYAGGKDGSVHVWEAVSGRPLGDFLPPAGNVTAMAIGPGDRQVVYGYQNGAIEVRHGAGVDGQLWPRIPTDVGEITALAFSPDGTRVVAGGFGKAQVVDLTTGTGEPALTFDKDRPWPVWSVAYSVDGRIAAGGWADGLSTIVLRSRDGVTTNIGCDSCQQPGVQSLAFDKDGKYLVSGGVDNTVQVWNAATGTRDEFALSGHTDDVHAVAFSENGQRIVSASDDETVRVWVTPSVQRAYQPMDGYGEGAATDDRAVALSPDTNRFAAVGKDGLLRVWFTGGQQITGRPSGRGLAGVAFDGDGDIATVSDDGAVQRWPASARYGEPEDAGRLGESGHSIAMSRDGSRIVAGGATALSIWTPQSADPRRVDTHAPVTSVAFSDDGELVAYGTNDGKAQIVRATTGEPVFSEPKVADSGDADNRKNVAAVAFSPDGTKLAAAATGDDRVRIWDVRSGNAFEMKGHELDVVAVRFTADGRYVVSGSKDDTVQIWNAATGLRVGTPLFDKHGNVTAIGVAPDDTTIVATRGDGVVSNWPGPAKWESLLCNKLTYNMNESQWRQWVKLPEGQFLRACAQLNPVPGWGKP